MIEASQILKTVRKANALRLNFFTLGRANEKMDIRKNASNFW